MQTSYDRRLGLFDGTMLVIGGIIGAGIFLNPAIVAARTRSAAGTLLVWGLGGIVVRPQNERQSRERRQRGGMPCTSEK